MQVKQAAEDASGLEQYLPNMTENTEESRAPVAKEALEYKVGRWRALER